MLAYRTPFHETTGNTPSMMVYGRELCLPSDLLMDDYQKALRNRTCWRLCFHSNSTWRNQLTWGRRIHSHIGRKSGLTRMKSRYGGTDLWAVFRQALRTLCRDFTALFYALIRRENNMVVVFFWASPDPKAPPSPLSPVELWNALGSHLRFAREKYGDTFLTMLAHYASGKICTIC